MLGIHVTADDVRHVRDAHGRRLSGFVDSLRRALGVMHTMTPRCGSPEVRAGGERPP